jgi:hypothetical protein
MKTLVTTAFLGLAAAAPAGASVIFMDDFSGYGSTETLNAPDSLFSPNWTTTNGTVDYLTAGSFWGNQLCSGGGNCVDLDGSTGQAGLFSTTTVFAQGVYNLLFQMVGSGRGTTETVTITLGSFSKTFDIASSEALSQASFGNDFFHIHVGAGGSVLSFQNSGGDNIGAILKTVVVETAAVPVPAAGGLMMLGLAGLAALRRRKATA